MRSLIRKINQLMCSHDYKVSWAAIYDNGGFYKHRCTKCGKVKRLHEVNSRG